MVGIHLTLVCVYTQCVWLYVSLCAHMQTSISICICVCSQRSVSGSFSYGFLPKSGTRCFMQTGWLMSSRNRPVSSASQAMGFRPAFCCSIFIQVLRIQPQVLIPAKANVYLLNHLSSKTLFLVGESERYQYSCVFSTQLSPM